MDAKKLLLKLLALKHIEMKEGYITLYKIPMVSLPPSSFVELEKVLIKTMGEEKATKQIYLIFIELSKQMVKIIHDKTLKKGLDLMKYIVSLSSIAGWGEWKIIYVDMERLEGIATSKNFPIVQCFRPSKTPTCHMSRGFISGVWQFVTGKKIECIETSCFAQGYPECTFRVGTKEKLKEKYAKLVKEQLP